MIQIKSTQYSNMSDTAVRVTEAEKFLDVLFGNVQGEACSYLWVKQGDYKATYPFKVSDPDARKDMARRAITFSDEGKDVYIGVNCGATQAQAGHRYTKTQVTLQAATVTDIDVEGGNHISTAEKIYPPNFNVAKSFLPFDVSLLVDSGYGLHGYNLYSAPIDITDKNRAACEKRNKRYIEAVRARAGVFGGAVDSVGDLPRVLRVPGTYNYKLGKNNAPLVKLVEVNDVRFTPADLDTRLDALEPPKPVSKQLEDIKPSKPTRQYQPTGAQPTDQERALAMLAVIPCAQQTYEDWYQVGMILKNNGNSVDDWIQWSRADDRFKDGECERKWQGFNGGGLTIASLHMLAASYGYSEKDFQREWHNLNSNNKTTKPAPMGTKQSRDNFVRTQDRIKSCPLNLRLPDDFIFGEDGIEYVIRGKKGDKYISAALTPIVPTKVFRNPINNDTDYEFSILVFGEWRKVEIPGTALGDRELVRMLNGKGAMINKPQYLNEFLNAVIKLNADILPRPKSYNQPGWTSEDFNDFAFPANGKSVVRREGYDYERILKPRGDREAWKEKFGEVVAQGGAYAKTIIGFACAAFLVRPLGLPNLQLHVHGRRSIGKTPMEQFAVSAFGDPTIHGLTYSFASTPKARLEMATAFRDFPMICEELESISKRDAEKIPQDVYQFFMGTSGQALKKDGTKRESKNFSGARLTSGEHSLVQSFGNAGEFKRVFELRCNTLLDEEFASDLYEFCAKNHGLFLEDWTHYIIEHQGQISKDYHQLLKYICAGQKDKGTERDRTQLATLVISSVAYQYFKVAIGLQDNFDCHEFEDVTNAVAMEMQSAEELDDTTRAFAFLKSFVAGSDKYFARTIIDPDTKAKRDICQYNADCYGKIFDNGDIAFLQHVLKKILEEHGGFVSAEKLISEFKAAGYLKCSSDKLATTPCFINGKTVRAIRFKADVFTEETAANLVEVKGIRNYQLHNTGKM